MKTKAYDRDVGYPQWMMMKITTTLLPPSSSSMIGPTDSESIGWPGRARAGCTYMVDPEINSDKNNAIHKQNGPEHGGSHCGMGEPKTSPFGKALLTPFQTRVHAEL